MANDPHGVLLTYEDYVQLPDDRNRYEILAGILSITPSPSTAHQTVVLNLAAMLRTHVLQNKLGKVFIAPLDVLLSTHTVVQPDIVFVSQQRLSVVHTANIQGAPDLVIEVLSPSTALNDRNTKWQIYTEHGVLHYWIADPARRVITTFALEGESYGAGFEWESKPGFNAEPFPGFTINLDKVWD